MDYKVGDKYLTDYYFGYISKITDDTFTISELFPESRGREEFNVTQPISKISETMSNTKSMANVAGPLARLLERFKDKSEYIHLIVDIGGNISLSNISRGDYIKRYRDLVKVKDVEGINKLIKDHLITIVYKGDDNDELKKSTIDIDKNLRDYIFNHFSVITEGCTLFIFMDILYTYDSFVKPLLDKVEELTPKS